MVVFNANEGAQTVRAHAEQERTILIAFLNLTKLIPLPMSGETVGGWTWWLIRDATPSGEQNVILNYI